MAGMAVDTFFNKSVVSQLLPFHFHFLPLSLAPELPLCSMQAQTCSSEAAASGMLGHQHMVPFIVAPTGMQLDGTRRLVNAHYPS